MALLDGKMAVTKSQPTGVKAGTTTLYSQEAGKNNCKDMSSQETVSTTLHTQLLHCSFCTAMQYTECQYMFDMCDSLW